MKFITVMAHRMQTHQVPMLVNAELIQYIEPRYRSGRDADTVVGSVIHFATSSVEVAEVPDQLLAKLTVQTPGEAIRALGADRLPSRKTFAFDVEAEYELGVTDAR